VREELAHFLVRQLREVLVPEANGMQRLGGDRTDNFVGDLPEGLPALAVAPR
jgi:hypothetical protein